MSLSLQFQLIQSIKKVIKPLVPIQLRNAYTEYRRIYPFIDRVRVTLYARDSVLPGYPRRQPLSETGPRPKISLIATVKNEAGNASVWLTSLLSQSVLPDELVIVDGGSTDETIRILIEAAPTLPFPLKLLEAPGANIARGRNIAIQNANGPVIACTDFGCRLDPNWLRLITLPFSRDPEILVSSGYFQALANTPLEQLSRRYFFQEFESIDPQSFLPSSRSVAFKKSLWEQVGGYPEYLTLTGEDTLFNYRARLLTGSWAFVPEAVVHWRPPHTYRSLFQTYYRYARGDGETGILARHYWYKLVQTLLDIFWLLGLILVVGLAFAFSRAWAWYLVAVVLAYVAIRTVITNRPLSIPLKTRFYPVTWLDRIVGWIQVLGFTRGVLNRPAVCQRQNEEYRRQLDSILALYPDRNGIIIYLPTHDWGFMFQRPHQIARSFAHRGYLYIYCTINEMTDCVAGFYPVEPGLYLYNGPMEVFAGITQLIVYLGSTWNRHYLASFNEPFLIYDQYDDLQVSSGKIEDYEDMRSAADVMIVTSKSLYETAKPGRPDVVLASNGVDYDFIRSCKPLPQRRPPTDLASILDLGRPLIGYSGSLAEWFDYKLLAYLSETCSQWEFLLIGVNYDGSLERSGVLDCKNIHWLGMKPYQELFHYVWYFDVGMIPFAVNPITLATSPIKLFEYAACQKPIVSTALPECKNYPQVLVAETYDQFRVDLEIALKRKEDRQYLSQLDELARQNTWERRVDVIQKALVGRMAYPKPNSTGLE